MSNVNFFFFLENSCFLLFLPSSKHYMVIAAFKQLSESSSEKLLDMMEEKNEISSCVIPHMHQ